MSMTAGATGSRDRFLAAAEQLFVENGYKGTTIRAICGEAGTSLGILNRHWASKEALFTEMLRRHFDPLHKQQNERFDAIEAQAANPDISDVIFAFFEPAFRLISSQGDNHTSIYSRAMIDPSREIRILVAGLISDTRARLISLVSRALPLVDDKDIFIVMNLILGAYVYPQAFSHQLAVAMDFDDQGFGWESVAAVVSTIFKSGVPIRTPLLGQTR